ncbi:MAG: hypothetical protein C4518_04365 [Desulfobacteraceae bacterium]|nr:MAG: hypothetical protein C4518_04365 [Desulfobacteraceae bacterium]
MKGKNNFYTIAHLVAAAIRIHEHRHAGPPTIEHVCEALSMSLEEGNRVCLKLSDLEIIEMLEKPGEARLFLKDHLKIETIQDQPESPPIQSALDEFKKSRSEQLDKIKSIQSTYADKKKKLHEALEQQLKNSLKKA